MVGYGLDVIGMGHPDWINYERHFVFNFGGGYMRNFDNFHAGFVFNDIYILCQDVCDDGCMRNIHLPTLSLFFGFGK